MTEHGTCLKHPLATALSDRYVRSSAKLVHVGLVTGEFVVQ